MPEDSKEPKGIIGETVEDGCPVIWRFVNEMPEEATRSSFPWLAVISWEYDGTSNNGMPAEGVTSQMRALEEAIDVVETAGVARHAFSRTGNSRREFAYYISTREHFEAHFNRAVEGHSRYPIEISYYEDPEWSEFRELLDDFSEASGESG